MIQGFWFGFVIGVFLGGWVGELMIRGLAWVVAYVVFKVSGKRLRQLAVDRKELS